MTSSSRTEAILYESEATLRLVDKELDALRDDDAPDMFGTTNTLDLPQILDVATRQIHSVLTHLRATRSTLQATALDKLHSTHDKLREVTSATEDAAINIMDACDRANNLVDELDAIDATDVPDRAKASDVRVTLRDELFLMMGALQFQDITAQQLAHASALLVDMEARLLDIMRLFDTGGPGERTQLQAPPAQTYDGNATTQDADVRQALADEIFTVKVPDA